MPDLAALLAQLDLDQGVIRNRPITTRRLADLRDMFADRAACDAALAADNPLLYSVTTVDFFDGEGDLHYGLGVLMHGRIGREYFLTKGHYHAWRPAAEIYIGLRGRGMMLLETDDATDARLVELAPGNIVYVPGHTAHRTINTGTEPLTYLGVYPAAAGHDYGSIARTNFRHVVVEHDGRPTLLPREEFLRTLT